MCIRDRTTSLGWIHPLSWSVDVLLTVRQSSRARYQCRFVYLRTIALTLAFSLILSRLEYCNAVLHGAPNGSTCIQISEAAACAELCSTNRTSGSETVSRSATTGTAALASDPPANRLPAGRINLQDTQHFHTYTVYQKNDTDVAHYNFDASTNFNYFWQVIAMEFELS